MFFNNGMTIWILAILVMALTALAGWRQGGIRAGIAFVGIIFATLLCGLVGKIFHAILPSLGASNPVTAWALAPICGFIVISIIFAVIAFNVHRKVDHFYRYNAGELRLALWERLNSRLGICIGLLNGAIYFTLISFFLFNLTYWTTQISAGAKQTSFMVKMLNNAGEGMQATGFSKAAAGVHTLQPNFYKFADLAGLLTQNPQTAQRFVHYPALTSLWESSDMQSLVNDATLTNALASGAPLGDIMNDDAVKEFLHNSTLTTKVMGILSTNLDDLSDYLKTGVSAKYKSEKLLGRWEFNPGVTLAWLRQNQPRMTAREMAGLRNLWTAAYGQTTVLATGDNQLFVKNLPRFQAQPTPGQAPFTPESWSGDWSKDGDAYTLHITLGSQDKFLTATTTDGLRLNVKDGKTLLVFDHLED